MLKSWVGCAKWGSTTHPPPPTPFTQAGKSCLEGGEAHPADDGLSGWAKDMGFVENIQHSPLVECLQVVPGERNQLHPGSVTSSRPEKRGHPYLCITSVLRSMAQVSRQHSTSEQM